MPIFDSNADTSGPDGAFFWHATSITGAKIMVRSPVLKPVGSGAVGPGFYVTTSKSDYQKAMALRARPEASTFPLILFYVHVPRFYQAEATLLSSWDANTPNTGFVAVQFDMKAGKGSFGVEEPIPMPRPGGGAGDVQHFKYGEIRGEPLHDPAVIQQITRSHVKRDGKWVENDPLAIFRALWASAQQNVVDPTANYGPLTNEVRMIGARRAFRRLILEIALKSETLLADTRIVGAQLYNTTNAPLPREFASMAFDSGFPKDADAGRGGFNDAVWVDLDALVERILRET